MRQSSFRLLSAALAAVVLSMSALPQGWAQDELLQPIDLEEHVLSLPVEDKERTAADQPPDAATEPRLEFEARPNDPVGKPGPTLFQIGFAPADAQVGDKVKLVIRARLDDGWHIYGIEQPPLEQIIEPTVIELTATPGLKPVEESFVPDREPEIHWDRDLDTVTAEFETVVSWTREFEVAAAEYSATGSVYYQVCTRTNCLRPETLEFQVESEGATRAEVPQPPPRESSPDEAGPATANAEPELSNTGLDEPAGSAHLTSSIPDPNEGLVAFLVAAAGAGFLALLTPCVFPMVPITVSVFLKQAEKEHHRPVVMASVYAGGIIAAFTTLGMVVSALYSGTALNEAANYVSFNLIIAGVFIFFGLNLLGMFELRVPSWLLTWSSSKESQGGMLGVLFMALTFTLVSFTCTFAFLGGLLAWAAQGQVLWPILGMLAFSSAFALPFFFLALFPSLLQKLPKSGGWMNTIKVTMGLIELGAALKFLSVADAAANPLPMYFDYSTVITAWMVLAAATGLYLLGLFRLSHDTPNQSISAPRFLFATSFLGLAGYMAVGLFAAEAPTGILWEQIHAMAPPKIKLVETTLGPAVKEHGLDYALDYEQALAYAAENHQPVFIDFTGVNCPNCRLMEKRMAQPELHKRLENFVLVKVYTDSVPSFTGAREQEILAKNRQLQTEWYQDATLPGYAVMTPDRKLLSRIAGVPDLGDFADFLDQGLAKWQELPQASQMAGAETQPAGKPRTILASQSRN